MSTELINQTTPKARKNRDLFLRMFAWLVLIVSPIVDAQTSLNKEAKVKAAYLFNFTKYIEWPDSSFTSPESPLVICIDRNPTMEAFMRALVKSRKVGKRQRPLQINPLQQADRCHLTYLKESPVSTDKLLVSSVNVAEAGNPFEQVAILFFQENGKLRFEIKLQEIERLKIAVSSELLKLARIK